MMKYDKYKSSEIDWLGLIPEHWIAYRVDWIGKMIRGNSGFKKDELLENGAYVALQYGKTYKVDEVNNTFNFYVNSEFYKFSQIVQHGDTILISTSETIEDLGHSCFYKRSDLGLVGGEQILLKPNSKFVIDKYLYYYTTIFSGELKKYATGLKVFRFNTDDLKKIFIAIPAIIEQMAIAEYLDTKTQAIDKKINLLIKKIEHFRELRKSIVNHAVSKGLDKNAKLKESGVKWIGKIPEHWDVKRLKDVCNIFNGATPDSQNNEYWDGGINWITPAEFGKEKFIYSSKRTISEKGLKSCATRLVPVGTIIISCRAPIGSIVIAGSKLSTNQGCKSLIAKEINNIFLYYYLSINNQILSALGNGTTFNEISTTNLVNLFVIFPNKKEQKAIATYLDEKTQKIDAIVTNIGKQIATLKELRKTLIKDVVTGKIKVTNI